MFYLFFFMYMMSIFSLVMVRKHIFLCLLNLEFVVVSLLLVYMSISMLSNSMYIMILLMVFFVCEGVLGLSVLVSLIRYHGNDYMVSLSLW
uniref:NADH dehydrogenase subunit 4L n=1 Tax=Orosius sp. TaxID=2974349 RepID=UPI0021824C9E|nr:NADH dehydrogenase subunit 4L [Orosius sp.]UVI59884.1 NADH dehydrogenase subunit 4L [Orosius sp.]